MKLQGMFGEPVVAELINLQVALWQMKVTVSSLMPVTFAVTDAMVQDCDLVMPVEILQELKAYAVSCRSVHNLAVTRSQSGEQQTLRSGQVDNTVIVTDQTVGDNYSDPVDDRNELVEHSSDQVVDVTTDKGNDYVSVDSPVIQLFKGGDRDSLIAEQKADTTLDPYWRMAAQNKGGMFVENGVLFHRDEVCGYPVSQLCVPHGRRLHLGFHKTGERVRLNFFWPGMKQDIRSYTSSCEPCQLRARARRSDHVPITPVVRPTVPFVMCHVDVIGPIDPPSAKGHRWVLCVVDDCTRWPAV